MLTRSDFIPAAVIFFLRIKGVVFGSNNTLVNIRSQYEIQLEEMLFKNVVSKKEMDPPLLKGHFDSFEEYMERKKKGK